MKKAIIAGAASAVLAAMPVVGVFAEPAVELPNAHTDILSVTIDKVCAFGYTNGLSDAGAINVTGVNRANGTKGSWSATTTSDIPATAGNTSATLSGTMTTGTSDLAFGTTTLGVYCNNTAGYKITSSFVESDGTTANATGALLSAGTSKDIPVSADIVDNTTSAWSYKVEPGQNGSNVNVGVIQDGFGTWAGGAGIIVSAPTTANATKMTTNKGDYFKITYGVKIDETQPADTYSAGITYTLAQLNS